MRHFPRNAYLAALLAAAFVACDDLSAPRHSEPIAAPALSVTGGNSGEAFAHVLRHDPAAPALETYAVSFWAYVGKNRSVEVRYQNGLPNSGVGGRFVRFTVPAGALTAGVDGKRLKNGDSLLITMSFDAVDFQIDFEPSGLVFARNTPAELEVWYGNASRDVNRDGVVDEVDESIMGSQLGLFHYDKKGSTAWTPVSSRNDVAWRTITGALRGFSGYAVSW